ncbi:MAG TPA: hypothetical protein VL574_01280 [Stellaceae bacterium]|nr:hypothetical protein [Stellaceae bacterium]
MREVPRSDSCQSGKCRHPLVLVPSLPRPKRHGLGHRRLPIAKRNQRHPADILVRIRNIGLNEPLGRSQAEVGTSDSLDKLPARLTFIGMLPCLGQDSQMPRPIDQNILQIASHIVASNNVQKKINGRPIPSLRLSGIDEFLEGFQNAVPTVIIEFPFHRNRLAKGASPITECLDLCQQRGLGIHRLVSLSVESSEARASFLQ